MIPRAAGAGRLFVAVMAAFAVLASPALANHSKLSLESVGPAGGNGPLPADLAGPLDPGKRVFMTTPEALTAGDSDTSNDLYSHTGGTTTLLSTGTAGGNGAAPATFSRARLNGTRVFFETDERLVAADTDDTLDVYMRESGTTTLISTGPAAGANGAFDSYYATASTDGSRVVFTTRGALVGADTDDTLDVYERANGVTTLVSTGPTGGNGTNGAEFAGATEDGAKIFFHTAESLVAADTDGKQDVYERSGGNTTLISTGPSGGNAAHVAIFDGISQDGSKVFFHTFEPLVAADTDQQPDVYERSGGTTTIHSIGPGGGNGAAAAIFAGASADGSKVWIETQERLIASPVDRDSFNDVYQDEGGTITQLTTGGNDNFATNAYFVGATADGSKVFFRTEEALVAADTDKYQDIYQYSGGVMTRLTASATAGNGPSHAFYGGITADGNSLFFETNEALVAADTDTRADVYEVTGGTAYLLSTGPGGGNGAYDARFRAVSPDGTRVFFRTDESLIAADTDAAADLYSANVPGTITVALDSVPNDPQNFDFQAFGLDEGFAFGPPSFGPTSFSLDDDSDPGLSNQKVFTGVTPGVGYSITQAAVPGWDLTAATCSDGSPVVSIDVSAGENVTCTFTNQKRGQIVVVLDAIPNDAQDFGFTAGGGLSPASFQLDDDSNPTLPNSLAFMDVAPGSGYSVTQDTLPNGWSQAGVTCDDGSSPSNISVSAGEVVTCTFTNHKPGHIVVVKDAQPNDAQDFTFTSTGFGPGTFQLDDDADPTLQSVRSFDVTPGSGYGISETVPSGWIQANASCNDGSPLSNINVSPDETVICTFTNLKRGQINIVKDAQPNDAQDFSFTAGGGLSPTSFQLDDDSDGTLSNTRTFANLAPGTGYSVSETVPSGWDQSSATCSDGSSISNIQISAGEVVTCTFTNKKRGQLTIVKDTQPNNGQDFTFTAGGGLSPTSFQLDDDNNPTLSNTRTFTNLPATSGYFVSENATAGWGVISATCSNGSPVSNIVVGPGEAVTCTFVNQRLGSLTIVKDAQPNDAQDFDFAVGGGLSPATFQLDDDSNGALSNTRAYSDVLPGVYSASETSIPAGWDLSSATCNDGSPVTAIDVSTGENVTCTFTNAKRGQIIVVKDAQPNDAQDFSFTAGGGLSPASFSLDDDSDPGLSNTQTFGSVPAGSGYSLTESVPSDWAQSSATCSDGSPVTNINVSPAEVVTCTFTNQKRGSITVVKDATPDDPQDFTFTAGGGLSPASFSLDDDTDGALPNTRTFSNVAPGSGYSLAETVPSGWDQTSAACDDGSPVTNINVSAAENVTCTFSNRKRGRIIVVKDATPDDAQDFSFTAAGGLSPTNFSLDDDANATLSNTQTFNNVVPGSGYSVAESVPSGWDQTGATCDDGSPVTNINVSANETVTCTFSNRKRATLVVVKDAQPDDAQDFSFTAGGGLSPAGFSLDDDTNATLSNTQTFANVTPGSGYSVSETVPGGWDQTAASCSDGSPLANIDLSAGETVTCTFTNRKRGQIIAVKDARPNDPQDFSFTAGGGLSPASFTLDDDSDGTLSNSQTFSNLLPGGGYSLAETVPSGWDQASATCDDGSPATNINVSAGEVVTCTFTNDKRGQISIVKNAQPDDAQDFSFTTGGGLSPASFALDDDLDPALSNTQEFNDVPVGSGYSVAEAVPGGWDQASATCDDGSPVTNISVSSGEHVTCTFTNNRRGNIVVVKDASPDDPQDFSFTAGGGLSPTSFQLDDDANPTLSNTRTFSNVPAGSGYSLSETVPGGWDQTAATCDNGSPVSNVNVAPGQTVTCTFSNRKRGQINVIKDATPDDPQDFSFTAGGGLSPTSFQLDDDANPTLSNTRTFSNVVPGGGYSLSETVPGGWDQTSAVCDDGSPVSNIDVSPGEVVNCTFSNRKRATLVVVKDSQPNDPQDFGFTTGGGLSPASFQLDDDSDATLSNTRTFSDVTPGAGYSVSENVPSGWDQTGATCSDGSPVSNVDLSAGETVTCTFTNRKRGQIVAVKDARPNDAQDFSFTAGGGLSPSSFALDDDSDGTLPSSQTFNDVVPGSGYSLAETVPSGWDQASATCDDGSPVSNINVSAGEVVTCTFTNDRRGQVTIVKDATPDSSQDFSFTAGGGLAPASFSLDDDLDLTLSNTQTFNDVPAGSGYSVAETVPPGWDQASATCDDGSPVTNISVSAAEHVTCTFSNQQRGNIVVVKDATPDDPQDFSFTAGGGLSPASFQLDDDSNPTLSNTRTFSNLPVGGGYSLAEAVPGGWDQVSATCDDGSPVTDVNVSPGETVTCTFSNRKRGQIVVTKDATPDDPQDFDFTGGGGLSPASFQLDDDSDGTLSNTRTFSNLTIGTYSLSETVPSGWDQTSATCDDGSPVSSIDVSAGEIVHCTFSNRKRARLVVVKDAQPNSAQDFDFTAGGGLSPSSFQLDDDSEGTLSNSRSFDDLLPGSGYSVAETVPSGWDQTSATCDDGSPVSDVSLSAGEVVTCTFTNAKRGQIVAVKDAQPDDAQDFSFTAGGGLSPSSFQLDDDSDGTLSNTQTFTDVPAGGGYSLTESVPGGWDQTASTCDNGSAPGSITVTPGQTVTCTFTNRKRGRIVIVKQATPQDPQDFSFTAGGGLSPASFSLDDDTDGTLSNTRAFENVTPGSGYSVAESVPSGWDQTSATCDDGSPLANISVSAGETVTCTFNNRKRGRIVAVKDATPNDAQDFDFTAGGGLSPASFSLDDDSDGTLSNTRTFSNVVPGGGYSLAETVPEGWDQTSATCDDGSPVSSIDVGAGEVVTCTFENAKRATLVVVKDATPDDAQDFDFTAGGGLSPASFSLDDDSDGTLSNTRTFANVAPGSGYSMSESVPSGWDQTSATCDDGSSIADISLSVGETVTCTFANRKRGKVVAVEDAVPNDAQDFDFAAGGGLSPASFSLDDDSDGTLTNSWTFDDVAPGAGYSLSQTAPSGWSLASATCSDGSPVSNIDVGPGETVTCTFTHNKHGSITVVKQAQPNDAQDFSFSTGGGLSPSSFSLDDDSDGTLANTRTFSDVTAQSGYSVSEDATPGWDLSTATCDDGSPVSNIDVGPGEDVTCTFTNRKRGQVVIVQDSQPDDAQDFSYTAGGGLSPTSFQLDDDANPTLSNTRTFTNVEARNGYSVSQSLPSGWQLASATCDDGSPVSNIDVGPGETITCTFVNDKKGRIVAVKQATPQDAQDFSFTAGGGLSPASFQLDDDADGTLSNTRSFDNLSPGSGYSLSESLPSGWQQTSATCDDGSPVSNINVAAGETVTCTFANRKLGKIIVVKDAVPDDPQDFNFTAGGGLSPTGFQLDDDADGTLSNTRTYNDVTPGSGYTVAETLPLGWFQLSATCSDGSPVTNVDVSAGETVTCTFVNERGYARPRGATPMKISLVNAYTECTAPNRVHGPPLASPSCNPPVPTSPNLTVGTPDANSRTANFVGLINFDVALGNPATPADEADVTILAIMGDVRLANTSDYTGDLKAVVTLQMTDRLNGSGNNEVGTTSNVPFSFTIPCTATGGSGNVGSSCTLNTSADAVLPGVVTEIKRSIWEFGDVKVYDGGPDGQVATPDNSLYLRQGVFVP